MKNDNKNNVYIYHIPKVSGVSNSSKNISISENSSINSRISKESQNKLLHNKLKVNSLLQGSDNENNYNYISKTRNYKNLKNKIQKFSSTNEKIVSINTKGSEFYQEQVSNLEEGSGRHFFDKKSNYTNDTENSINENISIYDKIVGFDIEQKITFQNLETFFFAPIPPSRTLSTNINIRNGKFENSDDDNIKINSTNKLQRGNINNITNLISLTSYDYDLEIARNNQIFFFAKIVKSIPSLIINIYISDNFTKLNNIFNKITYNQIKRSNFFLVGKIESNIFRNNFSIFKINNNNNIKIMNINYHINLLGLFGVRIMQISKYENNKVTASYKNEIPVWDNEFKMYKLKFTGRVKSTCKKNFILKKDNENILQCGKVNDDIFALDCIEPVSPFEAFCISLTSLVNKIACE